jgi:hypothetical protein
MRPLLLISSAAALASPAACSSQVTPQYQGEPLATIRGTVVTSSTPPSQAVTAAIVWLTGTANVDLPKIVGTRADVQGSFPTSFSLDIYAPPPADAFHPGGSNDTSTGIWIGVIVALDAAAADRDLHPSDVLGADPGHILLYFDSDGSASQGVAAAALEYKVPATQGYHLAIINHGPPGAEAAYLRCFRNGVCVHDIDGPSDWVQNQDEMMYAQCIAAAPDAQRCEFNESDRPPTADDMRCEQLEADAMKSTASTCQLPPGWGHQDNPSDLGDPSTVVLGAYMWEPFWF